VNVRHCKGVYLHPKYTFFFRMVGVTFGSLFTEIISVRDCG
jgi:hypothetical protein